jgi:hypothetical protein
MSNNNYTSDSDAYQVEKTKPIKQRGRGSVARHDMKFKQDFQARRRAAIEADLCPELAQAYEAYASQAEQGCSTSKVVPVTTRGIGLNTKKFLDDAENFVIESVKPLRANINQLFRYSLMQLAREMCLVDSTPVHVLSNVADVIPSNKVSAFNSKSNGTIIADAINSVGCFKNQDQEYLCYVPKLNINYEKTVDVPMYDPQSPSTSTSNVLKVAREEIIMQHSLPDPYTITIFNLRNAVLQLSDASVPEDVRATFRSRNAIPGAEFDEHSVLQNPNAIMPSDFHTYQRQHFDNDIQACRGLFRQVEQVCPSAVGQVNMNGQGSSVSLMTTYTPIPVEFRIDNNIVCSDHSQTYATGAVDKVARLRGYVNLMGEVPIHRMRTHCPISFSSRHPDQSVHSSTHRWSRLASDLSPFSRKLA